MNEITLKLEDRTAEGKKIAKLRESGYIPSIVYGGKSKPFMTQSPIMATTKVVKLAGRHTPVKLEPYMAKRNWPSSRILILTQLNTRIDTLLSILLTRMTLLQQKCQLF